MVNKLVFSSKAQKEIADSWEWYKERQAGRNPKEKYRPKE